MITVVCMDVAEDPGGCGGGLAVAMGLLDRALDALAGVPFADLAPADQAEAVAGLVLRRCRLEAIELAAVRAFDAGG